jgi:hypothetical protein
MGLTQVNMVQKVEEKLCLLEEMKDNNIWLLNAKTTTQHWEPIIGFF